MYIAKELITLNSVYFNCIFLSLLSNFLPEEALQSLNNYPSSGGKLHLVGILQWSTF